MCSLQSLRRLGPHGECGPRGQHPGPSNCHPRCGPVQASTSGAPSAGPTFACAWKEVVAVRPNRGRKGPARRWPSEQGRGLAPDVGSNRGTPRFLSDSHGLLPKGRVSACLWAAMRIAPGSWAGGAPCGWGGGPSGPSLTARQALGRGGPAVGVGGSPGGRPTSSTAGLEPCPCPPAVRPAGPRGSTTSWGRGRTGPTTTGTLVLTIPGRRPGSDSPPVPPWSLPRRGD